MNIVHFHIALFHRNDTDDHGMCALLLEVEHFPGFYVQLEGDRRQTT